MVQDSEGDEGRQQLRGLRKLGGGERQKTERKGREVKSCPSGNKGVGACVLRGVFRDWSHGVTGRWGIIEWWFRGRCREVPGVNAVEG